MTKLFTTARTKLISPMTIRSSSLAYSAKVCTPFAVLGIREHDDTIIAIDYLATDADTLAPSTPLARKAARQIRAFISDPQHAFDDHALSIKRWLLGHEGFL